MAQSVTSPVRVLDLRGGPYERGRQHGEELAGQIRNLLDWETRARVHAMEGKAGEIETYTDKHIPYIAEHAPEYLEEMRGIADGAGLTLSQIVRLNCFLDLTDADVAFLRVRFFRGCTAFGLNGNVTADGCTYVGQTYDMQAYFREHLVLLRVPTPHGGRALIQTFAGIIGCTGISSHGFAFVINNLNPADSQPGLPYPVLVRQCLDAPRLGDALGALWRSRRASGMNFLLGDGLEVVDMETTATDADVIYATGDYLCHANHYLTERLKSHEVRQYRFAMEGPTGGSFVRYMRLERQLRDAIRQGKVTLEQMVAALSDHDNFPFSVCVHAFEDETMGGPVEGSTCAAIIYKPGTGEAFIANGNPCRAPLERHLV